MKRSGTHRIIMRSKGILLTDVAKSNGLHPNTVRRWCRRLHIFVGLMRDGQSRQFKQALKTEDVRKFLDQYREIGGRV